MSPCRDLSGESLKPFAATPSQAFRCDPESQPKRSLPMDLILKPDAGGPHRARGDNHPRHTAAIAPEEDSQSRSRSAL